MSSKGNFSIIIFVLKSHPLYRALFLQPCIPQIKAKTDGAKNQEEIRTYQRLTQLPSTSTSVGTVSIIEEGVCFHDNKIFIYDVKCNFNAVGRSNIMPRQESQELIHTQTYEDISSNIEEIQHGQWKRIMLLVIAITVHNIPEGLAVGVGFGAIGSTSSATFESAR